MATELENGGTCFVEKCQAPAALFGFARVGLALFLGVHLAHADKTLGRLVHPRCQSGDSPAEPALRAQSPQPSVGRTDVSKLGPQVGERVPDFVVPDQNGRQRSLSLIMGPKGAMLVFVRSADW